MAATSTMNFFTASTITLVGRSSTRSPAVGITRIQCVQTDKNRPVDEAAGSSSNSVPQYAPPPTPTPPPAPKVSTSFNDVLGFGGVAPERINGRLAMFGFASAFAVEIASNEDLVTQVTNGGVPWFIFIAGLVTVASLVPLFQGVTVDSTSGKVMTSKAELWNGRLAMLGLVSLAITEFIKGGPLF